MAPHPVRKDTKGICQKHDGVSIGACAHMVYPKGRGGHPHISYGIYGDVSCIYGIGTVLRTCDVPYTMYNGVFKVLK